MFETQTQDAVTHLGVELAELAPGLTPVPGLAITAIPLTATPGADAFARYAFTACNLLVRFSRILLGQRNCDRAETRLLCLGMDPPTD